MVAAGLFEDQRYELIDGELIDKMGQNPPHASTIRRSGNALGSWFGFERVQAQLPIEAGVPDRERSLPEPDLAVLRESKPDYDWRHPRGDEVLLVLEVGDTTAQFDLQRKATLYARAGVPEYWVLDLPRRLLVIHRQTDGNQYKLVQIFSEDEIVSAEGRSEAIRVRELLPVPSE